MSSRSLLSSSHSLFKTQFRLLRSQVELTAHRHPKLKRGDYGSLEDSDVQLFERILGAKRVCTDLEDLEVYNTDWLKTCRGQSKCTLKPSTSEELSAVMRHCFERRLALCPQGGNTGLVGGSVPVFDELVISMAAMNRIHSFDPLSGVLVCDAGCILETLDDHVAADGHMMPLDLGAKGSCHIGGNVSTAAGGIRLLRYGSLHAHILGIEAVLADSEGTVLDCLKSLRKDNTGFHLPHLFVGAEGQLGLLTKVVMTCVPRPTSVHLAFLGCDTFEACCRVLGEAKSQLGEILSSFEFLDAESMRCAEDNLQLKNPLESRRRFYLLVETSGSSTEFDSVRLSQFLEWCLANNLVADGTVAADWAQMKAIWGLRERLAEALLQDGYVYKQDFSLPLAAFYRMVEVARERVSHVTRRVIAYGHLGDGNLHLNITSAEFSPEVAALLYPFLYEWVSGQGGSISAEHGLGLAKRDYAHFSNSVSALHSMKLLKRTFDPKSLLNPYKTIPG